MTLRDPAAADGLPVRRDDAQRGGPPRRREPRVPCEWVVALRRCTPGHDERGFCPAVLFNFSLNGAGLLTEEAMAPGEEFVLRLQLDRRVLVVYTVRYCRRVSDRYVVGAALVGFVGGEAGGVDAAAVLKALTEGAAQATRTE